MTAVIVEIKCRPDMGRFCPCFRSSGSFESHPPHSPFYSKYIENAAPEMESRSAPRRHLPVDYPSGAQL
jgi:hypothetical protein